MEVEAGTECLCFDYNNQDEPPRHFTCWRTELQHTRLLLFLGMTALTQAHFYVKRKCWGRISIRELVLNDAASHTLGTIEEMLDRYQRTSKDFEKGLTANTIVVGPLFSMMCQHAFIR